MIGVYGLVNAYRTYGHLIARLDPFGRGDSSHPYLDPAGFGLGPERLEQVVESDVRGAGATRVRDLIALLRETYCGTFAVEFMEIRDSARRDWLMEQMEPIRNRPALPNEERARILSQIVAAERFETFLHKRFLGQKRFSLEGGEALVPLLDALLEGAAELGAAELVLAMAHRGRLNVMAHTLGMPYRAHFAAFRATLSPRDAQGAGDVKYHRGYSADRTTRSGRPLHLSLCANPSHLEWINPIAEGIVRAKQNHRGDSARTQVVPVQIHGDASFTGQGVVAETLALSELEHYWTGGSIHIVVNNQIGFTTDPREYRFTRYPSDMAKVIQAPVFHVNADDPEACVHAARLAIEFRQRFREDVIIDLVCYRRHGHNETDDPTFTQPALYRVIESHPRVAEIYSGRLLEEGVLDAAALEKLEREQAALLEGELEASTGELRLAGAEGYHGLWKDFSAGDIEEGDARTAVSHEALVRVCAALGSTPPGFHLHPKLRRLLDQRARAHEPGVAIDWATAEALALGSLLDERVTVRLTGQDVERGTFSQRHAVLHDHETGERFVPLGAAATGGAKLIITNSMLSEAAVLGFEYGWSTVDPNRLAIWEAQYGDFANGAQIVIDQFVASAEKKWRRSSGLVMLLPHGYEGQGPEHSSARLERFLQLCAEDNLRVCNLSTPAQYFHALRRQIRHPTRKPLVLMTPKSLLRHPRVVSSASELEQGTFQETLDDPARVAGDLAPARTRRVLVCSGKVFYTLLAAREEGAFDDVAILRLEEIHPFPFAELRKLLAGYAAKDVVWVQEEPWNMGAWSFVSDRLRRILPRGRSLRYVGRPESASPATGSYKLHEEEEAEFVAEAFSRGQRRRKPR
jgi:2-oxoglutarate dehydrogenase E1 component